MFCCGGVEEENYGAPSSQYSAPPRGNTYGGKCSFSHVLLNSLVIAFNLFVEMPVRLEDGILLDFVVC